MSSADILLWGLRAGLHLSLLAIAIGFLRLWRGPRMADRVVALDLMTACVIGFCALMALFWGVGAYLDIALALSLVSFVTVVALARYAVRLARLEGREGQGDVGDE